MTHFVGRDVAATWNSTSFAGVREMGITLAGDPVDVTDKDDSGRRTLLDKTTRDEVGVSLSGVVDDANNALKTDWFARTRLRTLEITYPNGDVLSGSFYLSSYSETEPYEDATTFSAEFMSSGEVTFTEA